MNQRQNQQRKVNNKDQSKDKCIRENKKNKSWSFKILTNQQTYNFLEGIKGELSPIK